MRFWAHCAKHEETKGRRSTKTNAVRPKVGITVFLGDKGGDEGDNIVAREQGEEAIRLDVPTKVEHSTRYACPNWAKAHYDILYSQRATGEAGLLAWGRPEVILTGIRGIARAILKVDKRLQPSSKPPTSALKAVVAPQEDTSKAGGLKPPDRPALEQGDSSRTQVGSQSPSSHKGKEPEAAPAKPAESPMPKDGVNNEFDEGGTPNTVVLVTPPKDAAAK